MQRLFVWAGATALLAGVVARWIRPARLLDTRITAITPGAPPTASVVLSYARGAMPARVIVDIADRDGNRGSATIDGERMFVEVPLDGMLANSQRITTTATYRVLGMLWTVVSEFVHDPRLT